MSCVLNPPWSVVGARRATVVALTVAILAAGVAFVWPPARRLVLSALSAPVNDARASTGPVLVPFTRLAASQLGYLPNGPKAFTSPRPFRSFVVVNEVTHTTAWQGGPPAREVATEVLGAVSTVWLGDFTVLTEPGRYRIVADNGLESYPFTIGDRLFDAALRAVQRSLYFQRAFTAITEDHAEGPWVHATDAALAPRGVRHGWHDAGDFSLYNMTAVSSVFWLLEAYSDFRPAADDTNIPESGNGVPDLLDEVRWELEWLLSVATPDGAFRNSTCLERYAAYGRNAPEQSRPYVRGEPGTMATARAVGILAYASSIFANVDPAFAETLQEAAWRGWRYLEARPDEYSDGPTCAAYRQDGDRRAGRAVRMFAAAGMLVRTGGPQFREAFETHFDDIDGDPSAYRFNAYACLLYLRAAAGDPQRRSAIGSRLRQLAEAARADASSHPFEWAGRYLWGSIGIGFERTGAFTVKQCLADRRLASPDCRQPLANLDYLFGRNSYQFAYVSGVPGVTRARQHAFHHWTASLRATPYLFPGAVAGGPNAMPEPADGSRPLASPRSTWGYWGDPAMPRDAATAVDGRYTDNDSWSTNELAIGWQAVTLYNLYFGQWAGDGLLGAGEMAADVRENAVRRMPVAVGVHR